MYLQTVLELFTVARTLNGNDLTKNLNYFSVFRFIYGVVLSFPVCCCSNSTIIVNFEFGLIL